MGNYRVVLIKDAEMCFQHCDAVMQKKLKTKLEDLSANPFDPRRSNALKGRNEQRSARVGDLRILFYVCESDIVVALIDSRGQVYKHEPRLRHV